MISSIRRINVFFVYIVCIINTFVLPHFYNHQVFFANFLVCFMMYKGADIKLYESIIIMVLSVLQPIQSLFFYFLFTAYYFFEKLSSWIVFFIITVFFCFMDFDFVFSWKFCYYLLINLSFLFYALSAKV
jgi:hypothetical protein